MDFSESTGVSIPEFVIQEAKEKSFEIEVRALKEFEKEKKNLVDKDAVAISEEFEKKLRQKEMEYRIHRSAAINKSRLLKMEARNKAMMKIFSDVQFQIFYKIQNEPQFYSKLLLQLIVQGLIKLFEHQVIIKCLERDVRLIDSVIPEAIKTFKQHVQNEMHIDFDVKVLLDKEQFLELRVINDNSAVSVSGYNENKGNKEVISKNEDDKKCFGGVLLTNRDGQIKCKNTIDVRVDLCFQDSLPIIRKLMFPDPLKN